MLDYDAAPPSHVDDWMDVRRLDARVHDACAVEARVMLAVVLLGWVLGEPVGASCASCAARYVSYVLDSVTWTLVCGVPVMPWPFARQALPATLSVLVPLLR